MCPDTQPILIVDDVASEALTLGLLCHALGAATISAAGPAEAGAILARIRPSGIITDLVMPGADGLDCLYLIAERMPDVPVLVVTASESLLLRAASELGETYGIEDLTCARKPIGVPTLADFLSRTGLPGKPHSNGLH